MSIALNNIPVDSLGEQMTFHRSHTHSGAPEHSAGLVALW